MNKPIVYNETDFEENLWASLTHLMYKGLPFTGTVIYEGNKNEDNALGNKEIIEFQNGNAHGRYLEFHRNGRLIVDCLMANGKTIVKKCWYPDGRILKEWDHASGGREWYEDGMLKEDTTGADHFLWDNDGILAKKNDVWFYKNGQRIDEKLAEGTVLSYTMTGEVACKQQKLEKEEYDSLSNSHYFSKVYYYDKVIRRFIDELFTNPYPDLGYTDHPVRFWFGWVGAVYSENKKRGHQLMDRLMKHPDKYTREEASCLKHLAIKKESGSKDIKHWLEDSPARIIVR